MGCVVECWVGGGASILVAAVDSMFDQYQEG